MLLDLVDLQEFWYCGRCSSSLLWHANDEENDDERRREVRRKQTKTHRANQKQMMMSVRQPERHLCLMGTEEEHEVTGILHQIEL